MSTTLQCSWGETQRGAGRLPSWGSSKGNLHTHTRSCHVSTKEIAGLFFWGFINHHHHPFKKTRNKALFLGVALGDALTSLTFPWWHPVMWQSPTARVFSKWSDCVFFWGGRSLLKQQKKWEILGDSLPPHNSMEILRKMSRQTPAIFFPLNEGTDRIKGTDW